MKIKILTTFTDIFDSFLNNSIMKRAIEKKLVEIEIINIRDYTKDKYHRTDTPPVGGGAGLIMKCQPIVDALKANSNEGTLKLITSPRGKTFNQKKAQEIVSKYEEIIILCGHYEGIDERVYDYFDEEISIGDYILTGGETACFVLIDAITRLIPGVINSDSIKEESFNNNLLEYPQYTEPYDFEGKKIPDILYSGNHEAIRKYNKKKSLQYTMYYRKDLLKNYNFTPEEIELLSELETDQLGKWEIDAILKGHKFIDKNKKDKKDD